MRSFRPLTGLIATGGRWNRSKNLKIRSAAADFFPEPGEVAFFARVSPFSDLLRSILLSTVSTGTWTDTKDLFLRPEEKMDTNKRLIVRNGEVTLHAGTVPSISIKGKLHNRFLSVGPCTHTDEIWKQLLNKYWLLLVLYQYSSQHPFYFFSDRQE